jgi:Tol biopolymer transport system component
VIKLKLKLKKNIKINDAEITFSFVKKFPVFAFVYLVFILFAALIYGGCGGGGGGDSSVVSQYSKNSFPVVNDLKIGQTAENILISFSVFDAESDMCFVTLQYSTNRGASYISIDNIDGFSGKMASGSTAVLLWKPVNYSELNLKDLKIKVNVTDGASAGSGAASDLFSINIPADKTVGKISFVSTRGINQQIYIMNADGTNQYRLTDGKYGENFAAISPDGEKIAYVCAKDSPNDLYIMDSNGLNSKRLTVSTAGERYYYPAFSYDSSKIVFIMEAENQLKLCVINSAGGGFKVIKSFTTEILYPSFSPDGSMIAFSMREGGLNKISIIQPASGIVSDFIAGSYNVNYPSFSPDGSKLAFTSDFDGDFEIFIRDLITGDISKLTDNSYHDTYPRFTSDGARIIFSSRRSGNNQIYSINAADGTAMSRLTNTLNDEFFATAGAGYVIFAPPRPLLKSIALSEVNISGSPVDLSKILCTAFYEDNTSLTVIPSWTIVSGGGTLSGNKYEADTYSDTDTVILRASYSEYDIIKTNELKIKLSSLINESRKIYLAAGYDPYSESNIYSVNQSGAGLSQITFNESTLLHKTAISPDGTKIAYSGTKDNNVELFLMDLKTYKKRRLTNNSSYDDDPCFTPDSSKIIFSSNRDGNYELYMMDADGGSQTRLTNNATDERSPYIAKDGMMILYSSDDGGGPKIYAALFEQASGRVYNAVGLTGSSYGKERNPCFTSGERVVFESDRDGLSRLYSININGGQVQELTGTDGNAMHPSCLPGDKFIVYIAENNSRYGLIILNADTLEKEALISVGQLATNYGLEYPAFTYNKNFIIYGCLNAHILSTSLEDGQTYSMVRALNKNSAPSASADGSKIYYHSDIDNIGYFDFGKAAAFAAYDIYSIPAAGGDRAKITAAALPIKGFYNPSASRVSSKITATANLNDNLEIYAFDSAGGSLVNLTNNPAMDVTSKFSPDGSKIVFVSNRDNNFEIYLMNSDGSGLVNLTNNPASDSDPNFSPDGKKIVFSSDRDGRGQIYTMSIDGSDVRRITSGALNSFEPCFSPDGRKIVFCAYSSSLSDGGVFTVNVDGSDPKMILRNSTALKFISPSW